MNTEEVLLRFVFPLLMTVGGGALTFLFRRSDNLHTETVRQGERIKNLENNNADFKERLDKIDRELRDLPDKVVKRIKEGT